MQPFNPQYCILQRIPSLKHNENWPSLTVYFLLFLDSPLSRVLCCQADCSIADGWTCSTHPLPIIAVTSTCTIKLQLCISLHTYAFTCIAPYMRSITPFWIPTTLSNHQSKYISIGIWCAFGINVISKNWSIIVLPWYISWCITLIKGTTGRSLCIVDACCKSFGTSVSMAATSMMDWNPGGIDQEGVVCRHSRSTWLLFQNNRKRGWLLI